MNLSASQIRYEQHAMELARERMRLCPHQQAEVIAKHYAAHATMALNVLELIAAQRNSESPAQFDEVIARCVEDIKRNHRHDFGIELEWPKP